MIAWFDSVVADIPWAPFWGWCFVMVLGFYIQSLVADPKTGLLPERPSMRRLGWALVAGTLMVLGWVGLVGSIVLGVVANV